MPAEQWAALVVIAAVVGAYAGYSVGLRNGMKAHALAPEMQRLTRQLSRAWATIAQLQRDDWQERGIGR